MTVEWNGPALVARVRAAAIEAVDDMCTELQGEIKSNLNRSGSNRSGGGQSSSPGSPPANRSGSLSRSIQIDRSQIGQPNPTGRVGSNLPYAAIHEFGGVISAKSAKALTIPIHADARRASEQGLSPREAFGDSLVMIQRRGGPPLLVRQVGGKRARTEIMYVLKRSVRIPMRPYLRPSLASAKGRMVERAKAILTNAIGGSA